MFKAQNITVAAGKKVILDGVSLEVRAGEIVALLGSNGAGKSTLLKTMSGDVKLANGCVRIDDRCMTKWSYHSLARRRAVLPQHFAMNFQFTAREVALLGRNPHVRGRETWRDLEIVNGALDLVEAGHLADQSFPTLSGGERQRIHLARILAQIWEMPSDGARYLLLDEPTASLDVAHQHLTLKIAREFSRRNTGVLVVLHDVNLAASYADRLCLMKKGKILETGTPKATITAEKIRTIFDFDAAIVEHNGFPFVVPHTEGRRVLES